MVIARVYVALLPLALYLLAVGMVNSRRRPFVTNGTYDLAALAFGLSGMVLAGPLLLLMRRLQWLPIAPTAQILLIGIFVSGTAVLILAQPRRLVIYNLSASRLRDTLSGALQAIDPELAMRGSRVVLPRFGLELAVESFPALHNVSLIAVNDPVNEENWQLLEQRLRDQLDHVIVSPGILGQVLIVSSAAFLFAPFWYVMQDPTGIAQTFLRALRFTLQ